MVWKIHATDPPKPKQKYAAQVLWILAGVMLVTALLHLIRIDKLIPVVAETLGDVGAMWFVSAVVIVEVLAMPYLLQMKLSPAFRLLSGVCVVLAPLMWTWLAIWAHGSGHSIGELSSYVSLPSNWLVVTLNIVWVSVSFWALEISNYDGITKNIRSSKK